MTSRLRCAEGVAGWRFGERIDRALPAKRPVFPGFCLPKALFRGFFDHYPLDAGISCGFWPRRLRS
jgi:hypothetical protein